MLRYKLLNPGKRLLFLDTLIHPSSYALVTKYVDDVWPLPLRPGKPPREVPRTPDRPVQLQAQQQRSAGGRHRLDHHRGLRSRTGTLGYTHCNQNVRFFLDRNPEYHKGNRLITVFPITLKNIFTATRRFKRSSSVQKKRHQRYNAASAKVRVSRCNE
ncbi:hypothetical protein ACPA9J_19045 [Pseudomonas aeruginosa]